MAASATAQPQRRANTTWMPRERLRYSFVRLRLRGATGDSGWSSVALEPLPRDPQPLLHVDEVVEPANDLPAGLQAPAAPPADLKDQPRTPFATGPARPSTPPRVDSMMAAEMWATCGAWVTRDEWLAYDESGLLPIKNTYDDGPAGLRTTT